MQRPILQLFAAYRRKYRIRIWSCTALYPAVAAAAPQALVLAHAPFVHCPNSSFLFSFVVLSPSSASHANQAAVSEPEWYLCHLCGQGFSNQGDRDQLPVPLPGGPVLVLLRSRTHFGMGVEEDVVAAFWAWARWTGAAQVRSAAAKAPAAPAASLLCLLLCLLHRKLG